MLPAAVAAVGAGRRRPVDERGDALGQVGRESIRLRLRQLAGRHRGGEVGLLVRDERLDQAGGGLVGRRVGDLRERLARLEVGLERRGRDPEIRRRGRERVARAEPVAEAGAVAGTRAEAAGTRAGRERPVDDGRDARASGSPRSRRTAPASACRTFTAAARSVCSSVTSAWIRPGGGLVGRRVGDLRQRLAGLEIATSARPRSRRGTDVTVARFAPSPEAAEAAEHRGSCESTGLGRLGLLLLTVVPWPAAAATAAPPSARATVRAAPRASFRFEFMGRCPFGWRPGHLPPCRQKLRAR